MQRRMDWLRSTTRRWLSAGEDVVLVLVAVVLLLAGVLIVVDAIQSLIGSLTHLGIAEAIFRVAESALLALILAELVHSLLVTLDGGSLTPEPFLVIAIVAILRQMLFASVLIPGLGTSEGAISSGVVELGVLSLVILILVAALVLVRAKWGAAEQGTEGGGRGTGRT